LGTATRKKKKVVIATRKLYHSDAKENDDSEIVSTVGTQLFEKVAYV